MSRRNKQTNRWWWACGIGLALLLGAAACTSTDKEAPTMPANPADRNEMYSQRIKQFYSRRIGDIPWGAKSTGTFGKTGYSVIATSEDIEQEEPENSSADYGIARFQHSLPGGSTIGLLGANRRLEGVDQGSIGLDTTLFFTETLGMTAQLLTVHGPRGNLLSAAGSADSR